MSVLYFLCFFVVFYFVVFRKKPYNIRTNIHFDIFENSLKCEILRFVQLRKFDFFELFVYF